MTSEQPTPAQSLPSFPARTLRDACRLSGRDEAGRRCPACPLKYFCENDEGWLVPLLAAKALG